MTDAWDADVVVVGAGIGGLTAAAYLSALGKKVVVVDRHHVAGGNATVFTHHDYQFDVGVHFLVDCGPEGAIPTIMRGAGADDVRFLPLGSGDVGTLAFGDGQVIRIPRGHRAARSSLSEIFPDDENGIDAYFRYMSEVAQGMDALTSITGPLDAPAKLWSARTLVRTRNLTLGGQCAKLGLSARLRGVLGAPGIMYAMAPGRASAPANALVWHYGLDGGFYPAGGGQVIADSLARTIVANGGEIVLGVRVEEVVVERNAVRGVKIRPPSPMRARGVPEEIRSPVVLSNADIKRTFLELVGEEHLPSRYARKIRGYTMALPLFVLYLILDRDVSSLGLRSTEYLIFEGDDADADFELIDRGMAPEKPSAYMSVTSMKDPADTRACPPGHTNLQVMSFCPPQPQHWGLERGPAAGERYRRNPAYLARKAEWSEKMLDAAERVIPGVRHHVVYQEAATPVTHERFMRSTGGTSYGIELTPAQLVRRPRPKTPIRGLYLCGASTTAGGGIRGAMTGGVMAASAIVGTNLLAQVREGRVFPRAAPSASQLA